MDKTRRASRAHASTSPLTNCIPARRPLRTGKGRIPSFQDVPKSNNLSCFCFTHPHTLSQPIHPSILIYQIKRYEGSRRSVLHAKASRSTRHSSSSLSSELEGRQAQHKADTRLHTQFYTRATSTPKRSLVSWEQLRMLSESAYVSALLSVFPACDGVSPQLARPAQASKRILTRDRHVSFFISYNSRGSRNKDVSGLHCLRSTVLTASLADSMPFCRFRRIRRYP